VNTYDAVIVGGGIIGGSIAFELARRNVSVAVLDRQGLGYEASWAAAGILSPAPDSTASIPLVPLGRASLALYPEFVAAVEGASRKRAGYRASGTLEVLFKSDAERELSTLVTLHRGLGLACEPLSPDDAREMEPALGREAIAAALLPDEASVDNRALTGAVIEAGRLTGGVLAPGVAVTALAMEGNKCVGVTTARGETISAGNVILAAGCWTSLLPGASAWAPTRPVRGQMAALLHKGQTIRRVLRSERGYIVPRDLAIPQKLIVGATIENVGYEKAVTSGGIEQILGAANEIAPELARAEIAETWSGLRPGTPDQLPILGPTDIDGLIIATGHFRNGILLAPITAKLIAEWVTDRRTSFDWEMFSPLRFSQRATDSEATAQSSGAAM
jgi:glycine oxidase